MDEFGDHMLGCKTSLPTRTRLWHDPLVEVWLMLSRMAGLSCGKEVRNLMMNSGKRPDVAILGALRSIITDVRTVVGADPRYCADAAVFPGHGALWGAMRKNKAWLGHTIPQGGALYAQPARGRLVRVLMCGAREELPVLPLPHCASLPFLETRLACSLGASNALCDHRAIMDHGDPQSAQ